MRTFLAKDKRAQVTRSVNLARQHWSFSQQSRAAGYFAVSSSGISYAHDFSQIPLRQRSPDKPPPESTGSTLVDRFELEAVQVADRIMRMPEQQAGSAFACNAEQTRHQVSQPNPKHQGLQTKPATTLNTSGSDASRWENEIPHSAGQPLDSATAAFFAPRFGHDFSQVRVHTDKRAAEAASALQAQAFSLGSNIFFAKGQYEPGTFRGKKLIAHELTHVIQQNEVAGQRIQRQKDKEEDARFKRVPPGPGAYTEDEYKAWQRRHRNSTLSFGGPWQPDTMYARYTPEWFWSRGYFYSGSMFGGTRGARIEVWLSNEGKGKEYRVFRRPETKAQEETVEADETVDPFVRDLEEAKEYIDDRTDEQRSLIKDAKDLDKKTGTKEYDSLYAEYLKREDRWREELEINLERVKALRKEAEEAERSQNLSEFDAIIKTLEGMRDNWPCGAEWGPRPDLPPTSLDTRRYHCLGQAGRKPLEMGKEYEF